MRGAQIGSGLGIGFATLFALFRDMEIGRCERTPPQPISARAVLESTRSAQTVDHKRQMSARWFALTSS